MATIERLPPKTKKYEVPKDRLFSYIPVKSEIVSIILEPGATAGKTEVTIKTKEKGDQRSFNFYENCAPETVIYQSPGVSFRIDFP